MKLLQLGLLLAILGQMTNGLPEQRNNEVFKIGRARKISAAQDSKKVAREASNRNKAALKEIFSDYDQSISKHNKHGSHEHHNHDHKHSHKSHEQRSRSSHDHHDHQSHESHEHHSDSSHYHHDHEHSHESHEHHSHHHDHEDSSEAHDHHNRHYSHSNSDEHHHHQHSDYDKYRHHLHSDSNEDYDHHLRDHSLGSAHHVDRSHFLVRRAGKVVREAAAYEQKSDKNSELYSYLGHLTADFKNVVNHAEVLNAVDQQAKALGLNLTEAQKAAFENLKLALGIIKDHENQDNVIAKEVLNYAGILHAVEQQAKVLGLNLTQAQRAAFDNLKLALGIITDNKNHKKAKEIRAVRAIPIDSKYKQAKALGLNLTEAQQAAFENLKLVLGIIKDHEKQDSSKAKEVLNYAGILHAVEQQAKVFGLNLTHAQRAALDNLKLALGIITDNKNHENAKEVRAVRAIPTDSKYNIVNEKDVHREKGIKLFKRAIIAAVNQHLLPASQNRAANPPPRNSPAQNLPSKKFPAQNPSADHLTLKNPPAQNVPIQKAFTGNLPVQNILGQNLIAQDVPAQNFPAHNPSAQDPPAQNLPVQTSPVPVPNENDPVEHPEPSNYVVANLVEKSQNSAPEPNVQDITKPEAPSFRLLEDEPAIADGRKLVKAGATFLCKNFKVACNVL